MKTLVIILASLVAIASFDFVRMELIYEPADNYTLNFPLTKSK